MNQDTLHIQRGRSNTPLADWSMMISKALASMLSIPTARFLSAVVDIYMMDGGINRLQSTICPAAPLVTAKVSEQASNKAAHIIILLLINTATVLALYTNCDDVINLMNKLDCT